MSGADGRDWTYEDQEADEARRVEDNMIRQATRVIDGLSRPIYVFRMARACPDKVGSRERMLNAAKEIVKILEDE